LRPRPSTVARAAMAATGCRPTEYVGTITAVLGSIDATGATGHVFSDPNWSAGAERANAPAKGHHPPPPVTTGLSSPSSPSGQSHCTPSHSTGRDLQPPTSGRPAPAPTHTVLRRRKTDAIVCARLTKSRPGCDVRVARFSQNAQGWSDVRRTREGADDCAEVVPTVGRADHPWLTRSAACRAEQAVRGGNQRLSGALMTGGGCYAANGNRPSLGPMLRWVRSRSTGGRPAVPCGRRR
jgi:hypothetical protein